MVANKTGAGFAFMRDEAKREFRPLALLNLSGSEDQTTEVSQGYPLFSVGTLQDYASVITASSWVFEAEIEFLSGTDIAPFFWGQAEATGNITAPFTASYTVPAVGPYTLNIPGLTVDQVIEATFLTSAAPAQEFLTQIASAGTPAEGQFEVTADTVTFHSSAAGKTVAIYYQKEYTGVAQVGGVNAANPYENFEICMKYGFTTSGTRMLWLPKCTFNSGGSAPIGGTDSITREIKALIPTELGWNFPYLDVVVS